MASHRIGEVRFATDTAACRDCAWRGPVADWKAHAGRRQPPIPAVDRRLAAMGQRPASIRQIAELWSVLAPTLGLPEVDEPAVIEAAMRALGRDSGAFDQAELSRILDRIELDVRSRLGRYEVITLADGTPTLTTTTAGMANNWPEASREYHKLAEAHWRRGVLRDVEGALAGDRDLTREMLARRRGRPMRTLNEWRRRAAGA
jgi:hypothetical protein